MKVTPVAKRYALAIYQLARKKGFEKELLEFLNEMEKLFQDKDIFFYFKNPLIPSEQKQKLMESHLGEVNSLIRNFLRVLIRKSRIVLLPEIAEYVEELKLKEDSIVPVEIVSVSDVPVKEIENIKEALEKIVEGKPEVEVSVVPELIGGVVIKFEDMVIDGSLRRYLEEIKQIIKKGMR